MDSGSWEASPSMRHWGGSCLAGFRTIRKCIAGPRPVAARNQPAPKNLCIAGGVALNCVATGGSRGSPDSRMSGYSPQPVTTAIAIGCAYYGYLEILKQRRSFVMDHSYVGKRYSGSGH